MRLCTLKAFRSLIYAPGSEPSIPTLRARIKGIPGGKVENGRYWVDLDEYDRATQLTAGLEDKRKRLSASPELEGLV